MANPVLIARTELRTPTTHPVLLVRAEATASAVSAGADQAVSPLVTVALTASGVASVTWSQVSGPAVTLTPTGALTATFMAPASQTGAVVVARATSGSSTDDVTVTVAAHGEWWWDGAVLRPLLIHS